jgi:uncharacterized protein (DUF2147 family)
MNKTLHTLTLATALSLWGTAAFAQSSPTGLWRTIDDDGKTEKSLVRISDAGGTLTGKIEKIADPTRQDARCTDCEGGRKDQPVLGMTIIEGVRAGSSADLWDGGTILDPNNGKVYKVRMTLKDGGRTLDVRGYVGMPLLGRTQTWQRVE